MSAELIQLFGDDEPQEPEKGRPEPTMARESAIEAASLSENTRRSYENRWKWFEAYCNQRGLVSSPASVGTLKAYVEHLVGGGKSESYLHQFLNACRMIHEAAGHTCPTRGPLLRKTIKGARRLMSKPPVKAHPITPKELVQLGQVSNREQKAMIFLCYFGALRRSELLSLQLSSLTRGTDPEGREGFEVQIGKAKTDTGALVWIPQHESPHLDPVAAINSWLQFRGSEEGPLWRGYSSGDSFNKALKKLAAKARVGADKVSGHSLRRGPITAARNGGAEYEVIMAQSRHRSVETVMGYTDSVDNRRDNLGHYIKGGDE